MQGKFKCSLGDDAILCRGLRWAVVHLSMVTDEFGRAAAIAEMPLVSNTNW